ncbi:MAG: hypothetical protein ACK40O_00790 [Allosphingosinicella sp.]
MALGPRGVTTFRALNRDIQSAFGMRGIKATEDHFDMPFAEAICSIIPGFQIAGEQGEEALEENALKVSFSKVSALFRFSLMRFQPQIDEDEADSILDEIGIPKALELLMAAVAAAIGAGDVPAGGEAGTSSPRPPRGRRKS